MALISEPKSLLNSWAGKIIAIATLLLSNNLSSQSLMITIGSPSVAGNTAETTVDLFLQNTSPTDLFEAAAATLKFQIDDGLGGGNAPVITAIDGISGTPWATAGTSQQNIVSDPEFWDVRLTANFLGGQKAEFPANGTTKIATLTIDTTGFFAGSYSLLMSGVQDGTDSKYNPFSGGAEVFPTVVNGNLTIVPEPKEMAMVFLLMIAVFVTSQRIRKLNNRSIRVAE